MALLGREFVAVPDGHKGQIIYKWPDHNLRKGTRAIIEPDEMAVFVNRGQVVGTLGPGRHAIEAQELPFLGIFVDAATGGNAYRAELYFVGTREYTGIRFGGRIDDVRDPQTGLIVTLRVFGDYAVKVKDPTKLILNLVGTIDVAENDKVTTWLSDQLLKVMRTEVTRQIVRNGWPVLGLSAFTPEIETAVIASANDVIDTNYGVSVVRMGNFDVNLAEEDATRIKTLAKDVSYTQLAGGFQQYAAGEAMLGAGQGMAQGGGATSGAFLAAGLGVGQTMFNPPPPAAPQAAPPPAVAAAVAPAGAAGPVCASCHAANMPGAKFCASCGTATAPATVFCAECGAEMAATAKFCSGCGTPRAGAAPAAGALPPPPPA
jgi:membrane protease subunit (stomatin/prohibitin family)